MKRIFVILIFFTTLFMTIGCSRKDQMVTENYVGMRNAPAMGMIMEEASFDVKYETSSAIFNDTSNQNDYTSSEAANLTNVERKLVKSASIRIRVENLETADISITDLLKKYDAYAASTIIEENYRHYSLRVPSQYYDIFLSDMNGMGRLLHRSENTEDVTLRYYDLEGKLATKKELLRTFQSYLGRANNIEEILAVERRISELQYDIDSTGTQLRNLANRVDYATIDLALLGPVISTPIQGITFGERIKQLFSGIGSFLSTLSLIILGFIVYGIPILLLLGLLFWLLFGRIGLLKKAWRIVAAKKT